MLVAVIVSFAVVFVLVLMAVSVGLKFFDARRKMRGALAEGKALLAAAAAVAPLSRSR